MAMSILFCFEKKNSHHGTFCADGSSLCRWKCIVEMEVRCGDGSALWRCIVQREVQDCPQRGLWHLPNDSSHTLCWIQNLVEAPSQRTNLEDIGIELEV